MAFAFSSFLVLAGEIIRAERGKRQPRVSYQLLNNNVLFAKITFLQTQSVP